MTSDSSLIIRVGDGSITIPRGATISPHITLVEDSLNLSGELEQSNGSYSYTGGNKIISNYQAGEVVDFGASYTGWRVDGDKIILKADEGSLQIDSARNKLVDIAVGGNVIAHYYVASGGGTIDRREATAFEVVVGADNADNEIYAGRGASMWGGIGGNDTLTGGEFYDEFIYNSGGGQDVILNASDNDVVNLSGVDFNQFVSVDVNESAVTATFADGGSLRVEGNSGVGYKLGDVIFTVNQSTNTWSIK